MAEAAVRSPLIGEISLFGSGSLPAGWQLCDGAELPIADYQPLFATVGWRFGGDGWTTFAVPRLEPVQAPQVVAAIAFAGVLVERGTR